MENGFIIQNSSTTQFSNNSEGLVSSKAPSNYEYMISVDPSGTGLYCLTQQQFGTVGNETLTCKSS